jgi:hypothetical protein
LEGNGIIDLLGYHADGGVISKLMQVQCSIQAAGYLAGLQENTLLCRTEKRIMVEISFGSVYNIYISDFAGLFCAKPG